MPKYVVGCEYGHDVEVQKSFAEFDEFKEAVATCHCMSYANNQPRNYVVCYKPLYIKPQAVQFTVQAGLYDDFSTGSVQEQQLRREGYI